MRAVLWVTVTVWTTMSQRGPGPRSHRPWVSVARLSNVMQTFLREKPASANRVPLWPDEHGMPCLCVKSLELNYHLLLPIFTSFSHGAPTLSCVREAWVEATRSTAASAMDINEEAIRIHDLWSYTWELARRTRTSMSKSYLAARLKAAITRRPQPVEDEGSQAGDVASMTSDQPSGSPSPSPRMLPTPSPSPSPSPRMALQDADVRSALGMALADSEEEQWPCYPGPAAAERETDPPMDAGEPEVAKMAAELASSEAESATRRVAVAKMEAESATQRVAAAPGKRKKGMTGGTYKKKTKYLPPKFLPPKLPLPKFRLAKTRQRGQDVFQIMAHDSETKSKQRAVVQVQGSPDDLRLPVRAKLLFHAATLSHTDSLGDLKAKLAAMKKQKEFELTVERVLNKK